MSRNATLLLTVTAVLLLAAGAQATGGPEVYIGRGMAEAHAHLDITEKEWRAMVAEFRPVLYAFNVPEAEQQELIDLVATVKDDVVTAPSG